MKYSYAVCTGKQMVRLNIFYASSISEVWLNGISESLLQGLQFLLQQLSSDTC